MKLVAVLLIAALIAPAAVGAVPIPIKDPEPLTQPLGDQRAATRDSKLRPGSIVPVETARDAPREVAADRPRSQETASNSLIMIFTGGLLLVAAGQAFLFLRQLRLMRDSLDTAASAARSAESTVEIMRDTAQRQLRAYISIESSKIEFPDPGRPKATIVYRNAGQTPAYDVQIWIHQWIACYPMGCELPRPPDDFVMAKAVLGPGAHHTMVIEAPEAIARAPYLDLVGTAEGTVYVYGEIGYKDVFGHLHLYKYKFMYGGSEPNIPGMLKPCADGNEAS